MNLFLRIPICFFVFFVLTNFLFAQKEKDYKKENEKAIDKPGSNYTHTSGTSRYNPKTGKYEPVDGEWKKQPEEYHYDPKEWSKPKHKKSVYGKNPIRRLFKIKPKSAKLETAPSDKKDKKETPFTTGEEK